MSCNSIDYFFSFAYRESIGEFQLGGVHDENFTSSHSPPTPTKFCTTKLVSNSAGALNKSISFFTFNVCEAHLWGVVINNPLSKLQNRYSRGRQDLNGTCKW